MGTPPTLLLDTSWGRTSNGFGLGALHGYTVLRVEDIGVGRDGAAVGVMIRGGETLVDKCDSPFLERVCEVGEDGGEAGRNDEDPCGVRTRSG